MERIIRQAIMAVLVSLASPTNLINLAPCDRNHRLTRKGESTIIPGKTEPLEIGK